MATLRQLRTRVASITNIQSVTNAMQLVAAARMRRAQEAIAAARPYAQQLDRVLQRLSGDGIAFTPADDRTRNRPHGTHCLDL